MIAGTEGLTGHIQLCSFCSELDEKGRGRKENRERPWATDWTDFLRGVMPGTGLAASGSGNKSGHKDTASGGERVSRLMTYQIQRADGDIQHGQKSMFPPNL